MSTKLTIAHSDDFHLYEEWMDDNVWLKVNKAPFRASRDAVEIQLPPDVINAIRGASLNSFPHLRPSEEAPAYSFSKDEERFEGTFDSPERAAAEAFEEDPDCTHVWVGRNFIPPRRINVDHVIDDVATSTTDESGDWSDGYLMNIPKAVREDLRVRLQNAWDEWEKIHGLAPTWWNVIELKNFKRPETP